MKWGTDTKPKFLLLQRDLGMKKYELIGLLQSIWDLTGEQAERGDVGRFTNEEICAWIGYEGDPDKLINALILRRWLDPHPTARLIVHDWHEHCESWVRKRLERSHETFYTSLVEVQPPAANGGHRTPPAATGSRRQPTDGPRARVASSHKPNALLQQQHAREQKPKKSKFAEAILAVWNDNAGMMPTEIAAAPELAAAIEARLTSPTLRNAGLSTPEDYAPLVVFMAGDEFYAGQKAREDGKKPWIATLGWLMKRDENSLKVLREMRSAGEVAKVQSVPKKRKGEPDPNEGLSGWVYSSEHGRWVEKSKLKKAARA
jgi:hypothetical protein